jgi:transcriptional regulator with XRE-family HTH domain
MKAAALVAWNLRRLRVRRGLSQETLAADANVDRSYVGRLERAEENPTIAVLERLTAVLDARMTELFKVPGQRERPPKPLPGGRRPK